MENLDEFLNGNEAEAVEAPPEATEAPEVTEQSEVAETQPDGPVRDDKGRFAPKGEQPAESPAAETPTLEHPALIGERRRRQEAEARIAELEARYAQQAPQEQMQGPPDRWEDPEGYDRWLIQTATSSAREEAMQAFQYQRIETSAAAYRAQTPDYDEKIGVFGQMAQSNPALLEQLHRHPNPAEYAYNTAKTQIELSQHGGIEGLIKARIEEALQAKVPEPTTPAPIPETLADAQSARGSSSAISVPSLDDILRR